MLLILSLTYKSERRVCRYHNKDGSACDKLEYNRTRQLCVNHEQIERKGGYKEKTDIPCKMEFCDRDSRKDGFCQSHYNKIRYGSIKLSDT